VASLGTTMRIPISNLNAAVTTNTIDNALWAQVWNWNTLAAGTALTLGTSSMTTGNLLDLRNTNLASTGNVLQITQTAGAGTGIRVNSSATTGTAISVTASSTGLNSTFGFFRVANTVVPTTGTGLFARIQPNSTVGSGMTILNNGDSGLGTATPVADLQLGNTTRNRKLVLFATATGDHQFYGLGVNASTLRYQVDSTGSDHIWFAATSATTSAELMRVKGTGRVGIGTGTPGALMHAQNTATTEINVALFKSINPNGGYAVRGETVNIGAALGVFGELGCWDGSRWAGVRGVSGAIAAPALTATNSVANGVAALFTGRVAIGTAVPTSPLQVVGLPAYASDAAAGGGGLTTGAFYKTNGAGTGVFAFSGVVMVKQ